MWREMLLTSREKKKNNGLHPHTVTWNVFSIELHSAVEIQSTEHL